MLAAGVLRSSIVGLSKHKKNRGVDVFHKGYGRAVDVVLRVFERWSFEPGRLEQSEISRIPPGGPVGNVALRHRRGEAICMRDSPVRKDPAPAATRHAKFLVVDVAMLE